MSKYWQTSAYFDHDLIPEVIYVRVQYRYHIHIIEHSISDVRRYHYIRGRREPLYAPVAVDPTRPRLCAVRSRIVTPRGRLHDAHGSVRVPGNNTMLLSASLTNRSPREMGSRFRPLAPRSLRPAAPCTPIHCNTHLPPYGARFGPQRER